MYRSLVGSVRLKESSNLLPDKAVLSWESGPSVLSSLPRIPGVPLEKSRGLDLWRWTFWSHLWR